MSGTNDSCTFDLRGFDALRGDGFPVGTLLSLAVNPYNGLVVLSYQHGDKELRVADELLSQVFETISDIREFLVFDGLCVDSVGLREFAAYCKGDLVVDRFDRCPFCGGIPVFEEDSIVCCDGRLVMRGFASLREAVSAWNSRSAFVRRAS